MEDNFGSGKDSSRARTRTGPTESSHRRAQATQLARQSAEDRWEWQRLRCTTGPPSHSGRQKAIVGADEETLGREETQGQIFLSARVPHRRDNYSFTPIVGDSLGRISSTTITNSSNGSAGSVQT
jgi:hypothetical protein